MKKLLLLLVFFSVLFNAQRPIITKWNTNALNDNSKEIAIPSSGAFTYTWVKADNASVTGSGTGNSGTTTIILPEIGEYIVSITPTGTFKFGITGTLPNKRKLIELSQWGDVTWNTDLSHMFFSCSNLKITATDIPDFSNVTNMSNMFSYCSALTTVPNMNNWNTSNVIDMMSMFENATNFNQDIGNWNTSKVNNMSGMFWSATNFNQDIGNWNTSSVIDMGGMFSYARNFNQNIGNWNTSNVFTMFTMFREAIKFNQNLGNWKLSGTHLGNVIDLGSMFNNSGMSCENYSKTLYGWAESGSTPNGRYLGATGMKYGSSAQPYRTKLINLKGWTISGDSFDNSCVVQLAVAENRNKDFAIYPNPVKDFINFSEDVSNIKITDVAGRTVKEIPAKGKSVNVSGLAKGVYVITATSKSGETVTKKIVKE